MGPVSELLDVVTGRLTDVAQSDIVVGDPVELGGLTFVPLSRISLGFGGGGGQGEGEGQGPHGKKKDGRSVQGRGRGSGGGSGGGAKVRPVAVVVFGPEGVEVLPIDEKRGALERIFDKVPDLIERFEGAKA